MSDQGFRLSPEQRRTLAFGARDPLFTSQLVLRCSGPLDGARLDRAVASVVRRHDILRTRLVATPGLAFPIQSVDPASVVAERVLNVEAVPSARSGIAAALARERERAAAASGWPCRFTLLPRGGSSLFVVSAPAWCASDQSLVTIAADVVDAYRAPEQSSTRTVVQYAQYAEWRNGHAEWPHPDQAIAARLPFGTEPVRDAWRPLDRFMVRVPDADLERLRTLGEHSAASLDDMLLAWFAFAVRQIAGDDQFLVGRLSDARAQPALSGAVGLFVHVSPFSCELGDARSLADAIAQIGRDTPAWAEQAFRVAPPLPRERSDYLPIAFASSPLPPVMAADAVTFEPVALIGLTEPAEIRLLRTGTDVAPRLAIEYDPDRFSRPVVAHLANAMALSLGTLERTAKAPVGRSARAGGMPVDTDAAGAASCVPCTIERKARRAPDALAVAAGAERLTYGELIAIANGAAAVLASLGIGRESAVAVLADRSALSLAAMVGIMKAGAAYVPLDPSEPDSWIAAALAAHPPRAIVVSRCFAHRVPGGLRTVILDDLGAGPDSFQCQALAECAAYMIFTSGTTGTPKGVVVEHRQLATYVRGVSTALGLGRRWSFATVSTLATDLAHTAIYPTLCAGGAVHLVPESLWLDAVSLSAYLEHHRIDCLKIVPSHWEALNASGTPPVPIRRLVFGGETSWWRAIDEVPAGSTELFNHYGPTETTVGVATHRVRRRARRWTARVPIGRPIHGVEMAIVDRAGDVVPIGVIGDLLVSGATVARGYSGQPDVTALKFIPAPWASTAGARAYQTGDRARYLPGGLIECLGRADRQRKVRGRRIELGSIEQHIRQHALVRDAVVEVSATGDLVAFVVGETTDQPLGDVLRPFLARHLPAFMLPARFVPIASMPLTRTGKTDYHALAQVDVRRGSSAPPATPAEHVLARFWSELLAVDAVGVDDDFFESGGHSLLALQMTARIRSVFDVPALPQLLFDAPTIRTLARSLAALERHPGHVDGAARSFLASGGQAVPVHANLA